jgi:DNA-binding Lrp family transcriptional regulator
MDDKDRQLLTLLGEDARAPVASLARRLKLSRTTVQSRIERLQRQGVIVGYAVRLSAEHERNLIRAYIMLTIGPKKARAVETAIRALPEVRTLNAVSGVYDLVAVVAATSVAEIDEVIDRLGAIEGVERTTSSIILSTKIER